MLEYNHDAVKRLVGLGLAKIHVVKVDNGKVTRRVLSLA